MAVPVWPATLPQTPLRAGYSWSKGANVLNSKMDAGISKRRVRSKRAEVITVSYMLSGAQVDRLNQFFELELGWVGRFKYPISCDGKTVVDVRAVENNGEFFRYSPTEAYDLWNVSLTLEVYP